MMRGDSGALAGIVLAATIVGCGSSARQRDTDTYAIYGAVLDSFAVSLGRAPTASLRVARRTWPSALRPRFGDTSYFYRGVRDDTGVGPTLLQAYERANTTTESLCNCFPSGRHILLVGDSAVGGRGAPIVLSGVGFDREHKRALVGIARPCGDFCSYEVLFLVERRDGRWEVSRRLITGTS